MDEEAGSESPSRVIEIYPNNRLMAFLLTLDPLMIGALVWYLSSHLQWDVATLALDALIAFGALLFLFSGISGLMVLLSAQPSLVVDAAGLHLNLGLWGADTIRWNEVDAVSVVQTGQLGAMPFFSITPRDLAQIAARQRRFIPKAMMVLNAMFRFPAINIPRACLADPPDVVLRKVSRNFAPEIWRYQVQVDVPAARRSKKFRRR